MFLSLPQAETSEGRGFSWQQVVCNYLATWGSDELGCSPPWKMGKLEAHGLGEGSQHHSTLSRYRKTRLGWFLMASVKSVVTICFHLNGNCLSLIALFCLWTKTLSWQQNTGSRLQFGICGITSRLHQQELSCSQRPYLKYFPSDLVSLRITDVLAVLSLMKSSEKEVIKANNNNIFIRSEPAYINMRNLVLFL